MRLKPEFTDATSDLASNVISSESLREINVHL